MDAVHYSEFQQNLPKYMKQVNENSEALIVTGNNIDDTVVVLSRKDYNSIQETLRVISNDYVMNKIRRGDKQFEIGTFKSHELIES